MLKKYFIGLFILLLFFSIPACREGVLPVKMYRFEQELFDKTNVRQQDHFLKLQKKYGPFFNSFSEDMLNISEEESTVAYQPSLSKFLAFPGVLQLKKEVDSVFKDVSGIENELGKAMFIYHKKFPEYRIPAFVTFISEFGYANVTYDTIVAIGLDMYLGNKYKLYPALEFPEFMIAKLRREYIVPNTVKALGVGKFEPQLKQKSLLSMMLFEGKIRYFMKQLLPDVPDTLIFGYTSTQLKWAHENEEMIWAHLIDSKMIFNSEPGQYMRYFNDGPFTIATGVPQESAPAIGIFTGYRIIEKYMNENSKITLKELMENSNWEEILRISSYKPRQE